MSYIFFTAANAILPVVLLTLLGYFLRRSGIISGQFANQGNKLVFQLFLPVTLFLNVYDIKTLDQIPWSLVVYCLAGGVVLFLLGIPISMAVTREPGRRGVLLQNCFRSNVAIIGLSLASALGDSQAVATTSVMSAFTVWMYNMLAVLAFSLFSGSAKGREKLRQLPGQIIRIPMILGILAGFGVLLLRWGQIRLFGSLVFTIRDDLPFVYDSLSKLRSVTSPFALVVLGGQFTFSAAGNYRRELPAGIFLRNVFAPLLGVGGAVLLSRIPGGLSFGPAEFPALVALFGSPAAVSGAVIASQMDADSQLATQLTVWTSVLSVFTIFAAVCILMAMGLL